MEGTPIINFAAGPAKLPEEVLLKIQEEFLSYQGMGISILEMSHRSSQFEKLVADAEQLVRDLLNVPNDYSVLFLAGGACGQFAAIPLNLMVTGEADYVVTGSWSAKAAKEASKYGTVNLVVPKQERYTDIPDESTWSRSPNASYLFYCDNETIDGVEFNFIPQSDIPIVCDMSSNIFTRCFDMSKFGLIFAGSQKNFSCSGVTLVVVRNDLLGQISPLCPSIWDYKLQDSNQSMYNTPSTFTLYVMKLVLEWMKVQGGVPRMMEFSEMKSKAIYDAIESSNGFFKCPVNHTSRSRVNITFRAGGSDGDVDVEKSFLEATSKANMLELKGHRSVGGLRASLYNALSVEESHALANFMKKFSMTHS